MKAFILITVEALPVMEQEIQFQPSGVLTLGMNRKKKKSVSKASGHKNNCTVFELQWN